MPSAVILHVGPAKSGTTYLQKVMFFNRGLLRGNGVLYPGNRASHFWPALDLRGTGFKGHEYPQAKGEWARLAEEVRSFAGNTALISHETLARASPQVITEAVGSFPDSTVRVLITCRDLGRQIPATWQESVKNRGQRRYTDFLNRVLDSRPSRGTSRRAPFWRTQDLAEVAERWSRAVGDENVWLVTVPPPGAPSAELWNRFARAAGLPDLDYDFNMARRNLSLGVAQAELLRRLNTMLPEDLTWPQYERRIKGRFVSRELRANNAGVTLAVPDEWRKRTEQIAEETIAALRTSGYTVIGDLEDLRPSFNPVTSLPDEVGTEELLTLSLQILARMASRPRERIHPAAPTGPRGAKVRVRKALSRVRRRS